MLCSIEVFLETYKICMEELYICHFNLCFMLLKNIAQTIHRAVLEYRGLKEQFNQVAYDYHDTPLNDPANRNGSLATAVGNDQSGIQLSWDYGSGGKPSYDQLLNDAETLVWCT